MRHFKIEIMLLAVTVAAVLLAASPARALRYDKTYRVLMVVDGRTMHPETTAVYQHIDDLFAELGNGSVIDTYSVSEMAPWNVRSFSSYSFVIWNEKERPATGSTDCQVVANEIL